MKTCRKGLHQYPIDELQCLECHKIQKKAQRRAYKSTQRAIHLRKYWPGSTKEECVEKYNELFLKQEGRCAICQTHQTDLKKSLSVDHNHETGQVRGLLCGKCNSVIGLAQEDMHILQNAKEYLYKSQDVI